MYIDTFWPKRDTDVCLRDASDVARFSFIVQSSLSHLDLIDYINERCLPLAACINTEEKCRRWFAWRRSLLCTLDLDLPRRRECSLKEDSVLNGRFCANVNIGEMAVHDRFYDDLVSKFVDKALSRNIPKEKLLRWVIKTSIDEKPLLSRLDLDTASQFIDCFYTDVTDSALFDDFLRQFQLAEWLRYYQKPESLDFLLCHTRLRGIASLDEEFYSKFMSDSMHFKHYVKIRSILNYRSDFVPTHIDYEERLSEVAEMRPGLTEDVIEKAAKSTTRERICCMAQVIFLCDRGDEFLNPHGHHRAAREALRLIWSSIPDPCVTLGELEDAFGAGFSKEELTRMHDFYVGTIGEFHERVEPRSLKHLSRTVLRRSLQENNAWIPHAIGRTGLPKSLQAFLNLEKPFGV